jgi:hypothetical protein
MPFPLLFLDFLNLNNGEFFFLDRQPAVCQKKNWLRFTGLPQALKHGLYCNRPLNFTVEF